MAKLNTLEIDWSGIGRRRDLGAARQRRETERKALLGAMLQAQRDVVELRDWISGLEAAGNAAIPELERMLDWAKAELAALDAATDPSRLAETLRDNALFPEHDALHDSLGEPPVARSWGR